MTFFDSFFVRQKRVPAAFQMGAPASHKSTVNVKKGALGEDPKKCAKINQNWRPCTLEIYAFIQEGLQKSLFPPISKNLTKCITKCHQYAVKICTMPLWRPPRKHRKNKRKKQRKLDQNRPLGVSHERGFRMPNCRFSTPLCSGMRVLENVFFI